MKTKLSACLIVLIIGIGGIALLSFAREESGKTVLEVRNAMSRLETHFLNLQNLSEKAEPDAKMVRNEVLNFEDAAKRIRRISVSDQLGKDLDKLEGEIRKLKKEAWKEDLAPFRRRLDGLYETCFKCHATHAPPR